VELDEAQRRCLVRPVGRPQELERVDFDYCVLASGCNFGPFHPKGESLWFPTVWEQAQEVSDWPEHDERTCAGRKAHLADEHARLQKLHAQGAHVLVVGAGFVGVEWAAELKEYFPSLAVTLCDLQPGCLGPLPEPARRYCQRWLDRHGVTCKYGVKFDPNDPEAYKALGIARPDRVYVATGFKACNWYLPKETLSGYSASALDGVEPDPQKRGPGGGGWVRVDRELRVVRQTKQGDALFGADTGGFGRVFAIGDCSMVQGVPCPKISFPAEEQAALVARQISMSERLRAGRKLGWTKVPRAWPVLPVLGRLGLGAFGYPWGAGLYLTSLGSQDACFVVGATMAPGSGCLLGWGRLCALQKWFIEWSKVDECKGGWIGWIVWTLVH